MALGLSGKYSNFLNQLFHGFNLLQIQRLRQEFPDAGANVTDRGDKADGPIPRPRHNFFI